MAGYNRVVIMGNLTRDPEYKQLASGQAVCRLGLASNRQFRNKQSGSMVQEVCYIDVDVWGAQAESCRQYLQKGRAVLIEGRLKFDSWEDPEGKSRNKHSLVADRVVFLASSSNVQEIESNTEQEQPVVASSTNDQQLDQELAQQIKEVKARTEKAAAQRMASKEQSDQKEQVASGETTPAAFNDEPPFQDDLPF